MSRLPDRKHEPHTRHLVVLGLTASLALALAGPAFAARTSATITAGGSAQAWGNNFNGQLGNGTVIDSAKPVAVALPAGVTVTALAAGGKHSLAVTSTGQILAWGDNFYGQLGDGTRTDSHTPVLVALPKGTVATAVATGGTHSLAVTASGQVLAWGENQYGQLGDGSTINSDRPVRVRLPRHIRVIAVGASYNYSMALTASGTVLTWGYNGSGQLGNGYLTASEIPTTVRLPAHTKVKAIATGGYDGLVLTVAGRVLAWGDDGYGQLGNGTTKSSAVPVTVHMPAGTKVIGLGAGSLHDLALTSTGLVLAWGNNQFGQLGNGTRTNSDKPVRVKLPAGVRVTEVSAGGGFSLALTSTGEILAWGHDANGQLGNGKMIDSRVPVQVELPAGLIATALAVGPTTRHSLAIVH